MPYDNDAGRARLHKHSVPEHREQRRSPVNWRLLQMDAIYKLAAGLHLAETDWSEEETAGYERWALVKRRMR